MHPAELRDVYERTRTIAVVGASATEGKAAHVIPAYLQSQGYRIIPVNPRRGTIFGERVYPSLGAIEETVDVVDVFRPREEAVTAAKGAIAIGAKVLWFQLDTEADEAVRLAEEAGLTVVTGYCMGDQHGRLGLGPGPDRRD